MEKQAAKIETCKAVLADLKHAKSSEAAAEIVAPLGIELPPTVQDSAKIFKKLMRQHRIKRYVRTDFHPYLGEANRRPYFEHMERLAARWIPTQDEDRREEDQDLDIIRRDIE